MIYRKIVLIIHFFYILKYTINIYNRVYIGKSYLSPFFYILDYTINIYNRVYVKNSTYHHFSIY